MNLQKPVYTTYEELKISLHNPYKYCFQCKHYMKNPKMEVLSKCKLYTTYNFMEGNKDNELVMFARRYKCKGENFEYADRERILYDRLFK